MSDSSSDSEMQTQRLKHSIGSSKSNEKVDQDAEDQSSNDSDDERDDSSGSGSSDDEEENENETDQQDEEREEGDDDENGKVREGKYIERRESDDSKGGRRRHAGQQQQEEEEEEEEEDAETRNQGGKKKKKQQQKVKISASEAAKRGVVYISRPPPYMRPDKIRHLLQQYAEVTRIYLAPEDETVRRRRRKQGGNRKMRYTEGWVEFADRKQAKRVVALLNGTMLGGKKRFYREDLWTLKYLSKFKWTHLNEKMAYERIVREKKLKASLSQAKKESDFVRKKVGQARKLEYARAKGLATAASASGKVMNFKQRPVVGSAAADANDSAPSSSSSSSSSSASSKRSHAAAAAAASGKKQGKQKRTRTRFFNDDSE